MTREAKKVAKKKPKQLMISVEMKADLPIGEAIVLCLERAGVKKVLRAILRRCILNMANCVFPSSLFSTDSDEEMVQAACALYYLQENWDNAVKEGKVLLDKKMEEVDQKRYDD